MKKINLFMFICILLNSIYGEETGFIWQMPISINDDRFTVYQVLGNPNEIISYKSLGSDNKWPKEKTMEIF